MASQDTGSSRVDDLGSLTLALRNTSEGGPVVRGAVKATATLVLSIIDASEVHCRAAHRSVYIGNAWWTDDTSLSL